MGSIGQPFVVAFEVVRLGTDGPTVDATAFSTYELLALVVGRCFHGLVALVPISVGAAFGAGTVRRATTVIAGDHQRMGVGQVVRGTLAVFVIIAIATLVARPARTEPIVSQTGERVAGSIAELTTVKAGDSNLGLMIRGTSTDNPVVLFLAGSPVDPNVAPRENISSRWRPRSPSRHGISAAPVPHTRHSIPPKH